MVVLKKIFILLFGFLAMQIVLPAQQTQNVRLQLKWKHQFQFAGYYAAIEKGFYKDAGIEVELIEASEGQHPSDVVFEGKAEFGVCTSDILLMRSAGKDAIVLASIFQHSPQILLASKASGINHVHDLIGKRIAMEPNAADVIAYINDEGVKLDQCIIDQHSFDANGLLSGKVDAISAYSTDEVFELQQANFDYTIISPSMGGIDFYGDVLFTTEQLVKNNPLLVSNFREASLKGWVYAMNHPDEIIELILSKYSSRHSKAHLQFEAERMKRLVMIDEVEPGYTNPGRWESISATYKRLKMLDASFSTDGLLYSEYLKPKLVIPRKSLGVVILAIFIIGLMFYFYFSNLRKLKKESRESEKKSRVLFMDSPDAYLIIVDGIFVDCNSATERMMLGGRDQIIGNAPEVLSPEFQPDGRKSSEVAEAKIKFALEHGTNTFEWVHRKFDGTEFIVEVSIADMSLDGKPALFTTWRDITERKLNEKTLHDSEEKYRTLIETMSDGVYRSTHEGKFVEVNSALVRILGYDSKEELLAVDIKTQLYFAEEERESADLEEKLQEMAVFRLRKKDGTEIWVEDHGKHVLDEEGNILFHEGALRDVTDRKKAEEKLRKSEERYRTLIENMGEGVGFIDDNEIFVFANPAAEKIFGVGVGELVGLCMNDFLFGENIEIIKNETQKRIKGKLSVFEHQILLKDGSKKDLLVTASPSFESGKFMGTFGIFRDISDRRRAELALLASENKFRTVADYAYDWEYWLGTEGQIIYISPSCERISGYKPVEFLSDIQLQRKIVHPDDIGLFEDHFENVHSTNSRSEVEEIEFNIIKKDGSNAYISHLCRPVFDSNGEYYGRRISNRDITERKHSEQQIKLKNEQLQKLNSEKDKFFSIIAHDLKSPFNSIIGLSDVLIDQVIEKHYDGIEKYARIIHNSSKHAMDLLMNLMEWSRSQTGRMEFNPEYFELVELIQDTALLLSTAADQKSISIIKRLPHNIPVFADKQMISTVIRNLLSNAIKYTNLGGEIIIKAEEDQNNITVSVCDNGVGIPNNYIEKLFRIDDNYSTSGTQNEKGTGLGLILCKEFIEKHGGKIWVESEENMGSTFYFTIPNNS